MFDALVDHGVPGFAKAFLHILGFKAPLITVLPTPFYLLLGRRWHAALLVNLVSMAVLFAAVYSIGKRLENSRTGIVAVYVTGTMPLLYGLSRWFLVEYALAATVALAIALMLASDDLENAPLVFLCGVVFGLGVLLKVSFPLFVLPLFLYALARSHQRGRALLLFATSCVVLALPWYALNYRRTIENALAAGYGESAAIYGTGRIVTLQALTAYLLNVARNGTSLYYVALGGLMALLAVARGSGLPSAWRKSVPLALWLLPLVVFLFGANKDVRLIAPLLPGFALAVALAAESALGSYKWANALICLVLAYPLLDMSAVSFGLPFHASPRGYGHIYSRGVWPHDEILTVIFQNAAFPHGEKRSLLIGTDRGQFNANNFELAVVERRLPFDVRTTAYERNLKDVLGAVDSAAFLVFKEGGEPESSFFGRFYSQMIEHVWSDPRFTEIPYGRRLPDGGIARLFKNTGGRASISRGVFLPAGLDQPEEFEVAFGERIVLTGLSVVQTEGTLVVRYRWRCRRPPEREYWCFTHILDEKDKIAGYLDHQILEGRPAMTAWQPGDAVLEEWRFAVPASLAGQKLHLRLGLYHVPSGERLHIGPLLGPISRRFLQSDEGTALLTLASGLQ